MSLTDRMPWIAALLVVVGMMTACTPNDTVPEVTALPTVPAPQSSLWGSVQTLGSGEQIAAPAMLITDTGAVTAWTGADDTEARHYLRLPDGAPTILALKAFFPREQRLIQGEDARQLFWLDRTPDSADVNLQAATLATNRPVARVGPRRVSTVPTRKYTLARNRQGATVAVYSGTYRSSISLYATTVRFDRAVASRYRIRDDADYPVLVRHDENNVAVLRLYWLEEDGRELWVSPLADVSDAALTNPQQVADVPLQADDHLLHFALAEDATHAYAFWSVRHGDGSRSVWWSAGALDDMAFSSPQPLSITTPDETTTVESGYNSGTVYAATTTETDTTQTARWAVPAVDNITDTLPVALDMGDRLGIAYFTDGELLGYQDVVDSGALAGAPSLVLSDRRDLFLAWAAASPVAEATFYLTSTANAD